MSTTMSRATALIGSLVASAQAYGPTAPIQWRNRVVMPKISAGPFRDSAASQQLLIIDPPNRMYRDNLPYFTLNSDSSITLEGTDSCIEATSAKSGNAIYLNRCTGKPTQKWNWIPGSHGGSHIQLQDTNQCWDASIEGGFNGAPIVLWDCGSNGAEAWKFQELVPLSKQGPYMMMSLITLTGIATLSLGALLRQYTGPHKLVPLLGGGTSSVDEGGVSLSSQLAVQTMASPRKASHRRGNVVMSGGSGFGVDGDASKKPTTSEHGRYLDNHSKHNMLRFGPHPVPLAHVFFESRLCCGIVNLKPIFDGHVLLIPKRLAPRFRDLTADEVSDLYLSVHKVADRICEHYGATAMNIAQQDGPDAGQSVPHVHVHIVPRVKHDLANNDEVYEKLDNQELDQAFANAVASDEFADENRRVRTSEEMAAEASRLRLLFNEEDRPRYS